ncbi:hypothetical protein ANN_28003 [Periplaneta americana]|uniref:Uncharacterized protein n=1 Tax=Periplaneta americana TaxID=6978 RepID=A0ABQ8RUP1_PERAM|nr:hypothetical protein ANN_28003 [Periplaneta americana]
MQPFSIVEDEGFVEFVTGLNQSYKLPSRKTITKSLLPAAYETCYHRVATKLSSASTVCLTTDCWSSRNTEGYLAVTAHFISEDFKINSVLLKCCSIDVSHTSANLASIIKEITDTFNLTDKVLIVVSDNAANIKGAIINELGWKHFGCYAHTLNLVVQNALQHVKTLQEKVKLIVGHFKRSSIANEKLLAYQRNSGSTVPKKLKQEVPTRWNSTYYMLQRFVELESAVKTTIALINKDIPILSESEWKTCKELCKILKPFEDVTVKLSAEKYVTASSIIVITRGLQSLCSKLQKEDLVDCVRTVLNNLENELTSRLGNIEYSKTISISTFLDPRYKKLAFADDKAAENTKKIVTEIITKQLNEKINNSDQLEETTSADHNNELSVWDEFDDLVRKA